MGGISMKDNLFIKLTFVIASTLVCCFWGAWSQKQAVRDNNVNAVAHATASTTQKNQEAASTVTPTSFKPDQRVKVGCFKFVYNGNSSLFFDGIYPDENYFVLQKFQQEYDSAGNPKYTNIVIPDEIYGVPVAAIKNGVFSGHSEIESVKLGKNIVEIGWRAFRRCSGIKKITFPKKIKDIEWEAFKKCTGLKEIKIPKSVDYLGSMAFEGCRNLEKIELLGSPKEIKYGVFDDTKWVEKCRKAKKPAVLNRILFDASELSGHVKITGEKYDRVIISAFANADKITFLEINGVKEILAAGQLNNAIKEIKISDVKYLETGIIADSEGVETVIFGEGISHIPRRCFNWNKSLKTIKIYSRKK